MSSPRLIKGAWNSVAKCDPPQHTHTQRKTIQVVTWSILLISLYAMSDPSHPYHSTQNGKQPDLTSTVCLSSLLLLLSSTAPLLPVEYRDWSRPFYPSTELYELHFYLGMRKKFVSLVGFLFQYISLVDYRNLAYWHRHTLILTWVWASSHVGISNH